MECGLRAPAGCSVGPCGLLCGVWAWGSALGDHKWWSAIRLCLDGALGWRDVCPHSVGPREHLQIELCGPPGNKHHFSNPAPKPRTSVN